jgi:hypothetical protein
MSALAPIVRQASAKFRPDARVIALADSAGRQLQRFVMGVCRGRIRLAAAGQVTSPSTKVPVPSGRRVLDLSPRRIRGKIARTDRGPASCLPISRSDYHSPWLYDHTKCKLLQRRNRFTPMKCGDPNVHPRAVHTRVYTAVGSCPPLYQRAQSDANRGEPAV